MGQVSVRPHRAELDRNGGRLLVPHHIQLYRVAFEFPLNYFRHIDSFALQLDRGIAGDRMTINREQHVAGLQTLSRRPRGNHCPHEDSAIIVFQTKKMTLSWVLKFGVGEPEIDVFIIMTVLDIAEKALNHRGRNHISNAWGNIATVSLKCSTDDFPILHYRPATVARINLSTDLNRQVLIDRRMGVELEINPPHSPGGTDTS